MTSKAVVYNLQSKFLSQKCHNCFKTMANIMVCSKCKMSGYCSSECQRADWESHKITCKMRSQIASLQLQSTELQDNALLLLKCCGKIKQQQQQQQMEGCEYKDVDVCTNVNGIITCSHLHCLNMCVHNRKLNLSELQLVQLASKKFEMDMSTVTNLYLAFESNNFGILDELLECVAAGVFPSTAVINHSCLPNCILRYKKEINEPPIVEVVAITDIEKGTEITHSYVDCTLISGERKQRLKDYYGFDCTCERCSKKVNEKLPMFFFEDIKDPAELRKLLLENAKEDEGIIAVRHDGEVDSGIIAMETKQHTVEGNEKSFLKVKESLSIYHSELTQRADEVDESVVHESEIKNLINVIKTMQEAFGEYNSDVYTFRGQLMSAYLLSGQYQLAAIECAHIVNYQLLCYYTIPNHPLLGLQMFTLADLWETIGDTERAQELYRMSNEILMITHGKHSEMCSRLAGKVDTACPST